MCEILYQKNYKKIDKILRKVSKKMYMYELMNN